MGLSPVTILLLPSLFGAHQTADPAVAPLQSARRARATVEAAVEAVGGIEALQRIQVVHRVLAGVRSDRGQGVRPGTHSDNRPRWISIRDYRRGRLVEQLADTVLGGQPVSFSTIARTDSAWSLNLVSRTTRPYPAAAIGGVRGRHFRRHPEGLLQSAWQRPEQLRWLGEAEWEGRPHDVVLFAAADGEQVALYFDAATHLLSRAEQVASHPSFGETTVDVLYDDYRAVGDVRLPHRYRDRQGGTVLQDLQVSVTLVETVPDSLFSPPSGFQAPPPPAGSVEVAPGVVVLSGSYSAMAVAMRDHVIVLEGGGSSGGTEAQAAEIRRRFPGLPIRYVVATHHHDDHLAGLRTYVAVGATIVTTEHAGGVVRPLAEGSRILRPDALSRSPRPPRVEVVTDRRVFDDGENPVQVYQIGPNPHADQMLIAYLPAQKLVFLADLVDLSDGRVAPGGADTRAFAEAVARLGLDIEQIVAVHGGLGPADAIARALSGGT